MRRLRCSTLEVVSIDDDAGELIAAGVTRLEEEDFVRAYREVPGLRRLRWSSVIALASLAVAGLSAYAALVDVNALLAMWSVFAVLFLAWFVRTRVRAPRTQWRALPEHERQLRFEVRTHRLRTRTERVAVDVMYEDLLGLLETEHAFYLERFPNQFTIIPKSAFATPEEIRAVSEHLARRVTTRPRNDTRFGIPRHTATLLLWALLVAMMSAVYALVRE